jgi:RimJ/RimL family protein N-acetyltransferase
VYTDNAAAVVLYEKFGFEIEGAHRRYAFRNASTWTPTRWHALSD